MSLFNVVYSLSVEQFLAKLCCSWGLNGGREWGSTEGQNEWRRTYAVREDRKRFDEVKLTWVPTVTKKVALHHALCGIHLFSERGRCQHVTQLSVCCWWGCQSFAGNIFGCVFPWINFKIPASCLTRLNWGNRLIASRQCVFHRVIALHYTATWYTGVFVSWLF